MGVGKEGHEGVKNRGIWYNIGCESCGEVYSLFVDGSDSGFGECMSKLGSYVSCTEGKFGACLHFRLRFLPPRLRHPRVTSR